jgi:hypothetical protein
MAAPLGGRRWLRRAVALGLFAGTLVSIRALGFALNRGRAEAALSVGSDQVTDLSKR